MFNLQEIVNALKSSLSTELQEIIIFHVGDAVLYFNFFEKPGSHFEALVISQGGPGFVLEKAIRMRQKRLIQWLLATVSFPIDYLLASAVFYGDLGMLSYFIGLIGEDYKEYDTPARLLCILQGKLPLLEYLFQRNPTFQQTQHPAKCVHNCLLAGISSSSKIHSWYLRNQRFLPAIRKEDRIKAYLQNDNVAGAIELVGNRRLTVLKKALRTAPLGSEETYRRLMHKYTGEANVLTLVTRACVRLGYIDTLEILFNSPYNVHVEYDFFSAIPSLAVVQVLHKYAYQRNSISCLLTNGRIGKVKAHLATYQTSKCYQKLLKTFTKSEDSNIEKSHPHRARQQSEDVLLFLVDLAEVTSSARQLKEYIFYGIECGHLRLLKRLIPFLRERDKQNITQVIVGTDANNITNMAYPNIYRSQQSQVVEYLFGLGITQTTHLSQLIRWSDMSFIQDLVEKGLVRDGSWNIVEWNLETKKKVADDIFWHICWRPFPWYRSETDYLMNLINSTMDTVHYRERFCTLRNPTPRPISFSSSTEFSVRVLRTSEFLIFMQSNPKYWAMSPNGFIGDIKSLLRVTNICLLLGNA
ncbi:hypothetical protein K493DRAFT_303010 [Basidiobolus meristosporus CBS 931.73]|uniref:Uncharacterized protein n=1 Tax=Basidiobolus meristosporus CBS 931.73 TaxID=1314790 RepID=A0A1Y1Y5G9_9FUNG|nr:hypothetical protein K493DRAFT_303010 [Basidiobolus meristosporus CBS 931.73]|eukprot:ORX92956.1 hypothetical protein K493DRAFT_303010 [Basidiobolus meristosporus CBS 931.73]